MELISQYLSTYIKDHHLFIFNAYLESFKVNTNGVSIKTHPIYLGKQEAVIVVETWVYDEINQNAKGWEKRKPILVIEDGFEQERFYEIISDSAIPNGDITKLKFTCKEIVNGTDPSVSEPTSSAYFF